MGDDPSASWLAPLRRHRRRRQQGVPTVSVLVGPPGVAEWVWSRWQRGMNARSIVAGEWEEVLRDWLEEPSLAGDLAAALRDALGELEGVGRAELASLVRGRSPSQLEVLVAHAAQHLRVPDAWVRHALGLAGASATLRRAAPRAVARAAQLLGGALPALLVRSRTSARVPELAQALFAVTEQTPATELALALDDGAMTALRASAEPRLYTALAEGLIALRPHPSRSPVPPAVPVLQYDAKAFARSQQELALYRALERRSRTRGLFQLNVELSAPSGKLEVDLLCESLRVALEVDGYHHFRDADAYRRDRRKDVRLQELGYLVLRVLANDIDKELDHVLDTIDRALEERHRRS